MLEKMDAFFDARVQGYDEHMRRDIEGAREFYPFTASLLPREAEARVLDLGCGTGLELEEYFRLNPTAAVTGIDLSQGMLDALRTKFPDRRLTLVQGSYFEVSLGTEAFDAAVSVESLHHFTGEQKLALYRKLRAALKPDGYFVLTDYFAPTEALEEEFFRNLRALRAAQGLPEDVFYHYDTPLTAAHEAEVLRRAGFAAVRAVKNWAATYTLVAGRENAPRVEEGGCR